MLTVDISLEEKDYAFFSYYAAFGPEDRKKLKPFFMKILIYVLITILLVWINLSINSNGKIIIIFCCIIITSIALMVLGKIAPRLGIKKSVKKIYNKSENKTIFENREYIFDESGIAVKGRSFSTKASWDIFIKKVNTADYLLLYVSDLQAYIIPKRFFDEQQKDTLNKLLLQHLSFQADVGHAIAD